MPPLDSVPTIPLGRVTREGQLVRAWAVFAIKAASVDEENWTFEGIASTPTTDRMGDVVEPAGVTAAEVLPMMWQHGHGTIADPVGWIQLQPGKKDIRVKGQVAKPKPDYPPQLRDEQQGVWVKIRDGIVRGLSIGFRSLKDEPINPKDPWFGGTHFLETEILEVSPVGIPANQDATITSVKQFDTSAPAATGHTKALAVSARVTLSPPPGASGSKTTKGNAMDDNTQLAPWEAKRAASVARLDAIMKAAGADSSTLTAEQEAEYDALQAEVEKVDKHLVRLRTHNAIIANSTQPVPAAAGTDEGLANRIRTGELVLHANQNLPKGIGLARYVKAFAFGRGNYDAAIKYASQWDASTPEVAEALKTAVTAGTTTDATWAGPLVYSQNLTSEFLEYLRPQTILGKIDGFRRVPFNIRYPTQTAGSTVAWVGQGAPKPVSSLAFSSGSLGFAKAAGIVIITMELARFSSPSAELLVRNDLTNAMKAFLDVQFIDPSVAAVANVSPASVTNGSGNVKQTTAAWTTVSAIETDVLPFLAAFSTAEISLDSTAYWIMTPEAALRLSMIRTTQGELAYPGLGLNGGTWFGIPVITSNSVPHSVSAGSIIVLVIASQIFLADDGAVAIDTSTEASLQMDTAPTNNSATPTATSVVSMFQTNSIAIRAERVINWSRARSNGAGYLDNVHFS